MKHVIRIALGAALLFTSLPRMASAVDTALRDEADRHFRHARGLIQENCKGCGQLEKEPLNRGLVEMRQAIDMNCEDKTEAHQVLAEGYKTYLSAFVTPGSPELDKLIPEVTRVYDYLIEKNPADAELQFERAKLFRKKDEKLAGFRRVLETDPNHAPARFAVSYLLLEAGKTAEGLEEFRRLRPSAVKAELYRNTVAALLQKQGLTQEADQVRQESFAYPRYAERPAN